MGMYDEVFCEVELPDGYDHVTHVFQTKQFENLMNKYIITKDGNLILKSYKCVMRPEVPEITEMGHLPNWLWKGFPLCDLVLDKVEDTEFHGDFIFYDFSEINEENRENVEDRWHEYIARFSYGKLDYIKREPLIPVSPEQ